MTAQTPQRNAAVRGRRIEQSRDGGRRLAEFLDRYRRVMVLTGAGCSTECGIPDYRDDDGAWKHRRPVLYQDFVADPAVRCRYWSRSFVGWRRIAAAEPGQSHRALAALQRDARLGSLVTQNVDGLHQRAGHRGVIDLHGRLDSVVCLGCGRRLPRSRYQNMLAAANPDRANVAAASSRAKPDGDADIGEPAVAGFQVPACRCGGLLKPDVVFFGESVPRPRVARAYAALAEAGALLIVGSSLMVYSGLRFARAAHTAGLAVAAVNRGRTRADELLDFKITAPCGEVLEACREQLSPTALPRQVPAPH